MPRTQFDDRAVDTTLSVGIDNVAASPNLDVGDVTNWPVPAAGEDAVALVGFGTPTVEPIRYTGVDAANGILTGTSRTAALMVAHSAGERVVHGGDAQFLESLARKDVAQTFTEDQAIEALNALFVGGRGVVSGAASSTYHANNARFDGTNWVRTAAVNAASMWFQDGTALFVYTNSDANNTVGSIITWSARTFWRIDGTIGGVPVFKDGASVIGEFQIAVEETNKQGYGAGIGFFHRTISGVRKLAAKITADGEASWDDTLANQDTGLRFFTMLDGVLAERMRLNSAGQLSVIGPAASRSISTRAAGDADDRVLLATDGKLWFGNGSAGVDTNLYRWATQPELITDNPFWVRNATGMFIGVDATYTKLVAGTGSPEGVVAAYPGSVYFNRAGGAGTSFYVKQSGTGNTGWVGK